MRNGDGVPASPTAQGNSLTRWASAVHFSRGTPFPFYSCSDEEVSCFKGREQEPETEWLEHLRE